MEYLSIARNFRHGGQHNQCVNPVKRFYNASEMQVPVISAIKHGSLVTYQVLACQFSSNREVRFIVGSFKPNDLDHWQKAQKGSISSSQQATYIEVHETNKIPNDNVNRTHCIA